MGIFFRIILSALLLSGCVKSVPTCGLCQGLGGAWLPDDGGCAHTCEEQAEGVLCVERVCPGEAAGSRGQAKTCEDCILLRGVWHLDARECLDGCAEGAACFATRCPDGPDSAHKVGGGGELE